MERIPLLILKYLQNEITPPEQQELDDWLSRSPHNRQVFSELSHPDNVAGALKKFKGFNEREAWKVVSEKRRREARALRRSRNTAKNRLLYGMAVFLMILITAGVYWGSMNKERPGIQKPAAVRNQDIPPGGNKALLILADGTHIELDTANNGLLGSQGTATVIKLESGQLAYKSGDEQASGRPEKTLYNTIATPRGGQYQVLLPDGTRVWLNAASSIRFPTSFKGRYRPVELTGEAYFEVAANSTLPFLVRTGRTEIQVLGTSFNINAYEDETSISTTLIEGKVRVTALDIPSENEAVLSPGEQVRIYTGKLQLHRQVNLEEVIAWKNGYFSFDKANIQVVMRQLARWYNLEVIYAGPVPAKRFTGGMQRSLSLPAVLSILKDNNIKFEINGRTITLL